MARRGGDRGGRRSGRLQGWGPSPASQGGFPGAAGVPGMNKKDTCRTTNNINNKEVEERPIAPYAGIPAPPSYLWEDPPPTPNPLLLTDTQIRSFIANGYLCLHPTLPPGTDESIIRAANEALRSAGGPGESNSTPLGNNILSAAPQLDTVFSSREVDGALRSLLGDGYVLHPHRSPHNTEPGKRPQTVHKDSFFGFEGHRNHFVEWVMVMYYPQKTTLDMAPTSVIPTTQYWSAEDRYEGRHLGDDIRESTLNKWRTKEIHMTCEAGSVVLIHYDVFHRGTANRSQFRRWMFKFQYFRTAPPGLTGGGPCMLVNEKDDKTRPPPSPWVDALTHWDSPLDHHEEILRTRGLIWNFIWSWLRFLPVERDESQCQLSVDRMVEQIIEATSDDDRIAGVYQLAMAPEVDQEASIHLCRLMIRGNTPAIRRAAKFGASAACYHQLQKGESELPMVHELLGVLADPTIGPEGVSAAAKALGSHRSWGLASPDLREHVTEVLIKRIQTPQPQTSKNECNGRAFAVETLAGLGYYDNTQDRVVRFLCDIISHGSADPRRIVRAGQRQLGEVLMAATRGAIFLAPWVRGGLVQKLSEALVDVVRGIALVNPPPGGRKPGQGGTAGADCGLRYTVGYAVEGLCRLNHPPSLRVAYQALGGGGHLPIIDGDGEVAHGQRCRVLKFRWCHLTTAQHAF